MNDFNPYLRKSEDFVLPVPTATEALFMRIKFGIQVASPTILIIDASHWNDDINWEQIVASGVVAVILKCSEGAEGTYYEYKDIKFEKNWRSALEHGLIVMVYHFGRGEKGSEEKSWFMKCADTFLQEVDGKTCVWDDCEWKPPGMATSTYTNRVAGFVSLIQGENIKSGVYSSPGLVPQLFYQPNIDWNSMELWNAHWINAQQPVMPLGWPRDKMSFWQKGISPTHSWVPIVQGAGTVDINFGYFADAIALRNWLGQFGTPPPVDCCNEIKIEIQRLDVENRFIKGELAGLNQRAERTEQRADLTDQEIVLLNQDMAVIDNLLAEVRKIFS